MNVESSVYDKEMGAETPVDQEAAPATQVPDQAVVRRLRWKQDLIILPTLVIMYTFK